MIVSGIERLCGQALIHTIGMERVLLGIELGEPPPGAHPQSAVVVPKNTQDAVIWQTAVVCSEAYEGVRLAIKLVEPSTLGAYPEPSCRIFIDRQYDVIAQTARVSSVVGIPCNSVHLGVEATKTASCTNPKLSFLVFKEGLDGVLAQAVESFRLRVH